MSKFVTLKTGSFGRKHIHLMVAHAKQQVPDVAVFFHGLWSTALQKRYISIATYLKQRNISHTILFESSRVRSYKEFERSGEPFDTYGRDFEGKTYAQELYDGEEVMNYITEHKKTFTTAKNLNLHFIGVSMGGILSNELIPRYASSIKTITLLGSGLKVNLKNSVTEGMPSEKRILQRYRDFTGGLGIIHGMKDTTISLRSALQIFNQTPRAQFKNMLILPQTDHRLRFIGEVSKVDELTKVLSVFVADIIKTSHMLA